MVENQPADFKNTSYGGEPNQLFFMRFMQETLVNYGPF